MTTEEEIDLAAEIKSIRSVLEDLCKSALCDAAAANLSNDLSNDLSNERDEEPKVAEAVRSFGVGDWIKARGERGVVMRVVGQSVHASFHTGAGRYPVQDVSLTQLCPLQVGKVVMFSASGRMGIVREIDTEPAYSVIVKVALPSGRTVVIDQVKGGGTRGTDALYPISDKEARMAGFEPSSIPETLKAGDFVKYEVEPKEDGSVWQCGMVMGVSVCEHPNQKEIGPSVFETQLRLRALMIDPGAEWRAEEVTVDASVVKKWVPSAQEAEFLRDPWKKEEAQEEAKAEREEMSEMMRRLKALEEMRERSGGQQSASRLTQFLYLLMRDHLPPGVVESIMDGCERNVAPSEEGAKFIFTNGWLAQHAKDLASRLGFSEASVAVLDAARAFDAQSMPEPRRMSAHALARAINTWVKGWPMAYEQPGVYYDQDTGPASDDDDFGFR